MDWLFEANREEGRRFPWISIPGVASIDFARIGVLVEFRYLDLEGFFEIRGRRY